MNNVPDIRFFLKENVRYLVWTCKDQVFVSDVISEVGFCQFWLMSSDLGSSR